MYGGNDVQSTSQSNFENDDTQVDTTSQTDFADDERSMVANDGSGSDCDGIDDDRSMDVNVGSDSDDSSQHDSDGSSQHSDFSENSQQSSDEEWGNTMDGRYNFWNQEMVKNMKKWSGDKIKKVIPSVFYTLTRVSRALARDGILKSIMGTAEHFQDMYCSRSKYEALGRAVSKRRFLISDTLASAADHPSDNSMESSDNDSSDGSDRDFDIWEFINDILDDENVSGSARTKRGVELILFYMRNADAWRQDSIYRSIKKISKQKVKHMSLANALKYAICRKKHEILRVVKLGKRADTDESESDNDDVFESDNDGYENLKKLTPTVVERESESDNDDTDESESDTDESESDNDDVFEKVTTKAMKRDNDDTDESESDNDGYEGDCESENDDESTAKRKKLSKPQHPWIEYCVNQARANPSHNFKGL
jgi:hypothetical protein